MLGVIRHLSFINNKEIFSQKICSHFYLLPQRKSVLNVHPDAEAETPILWPPDVKSRLIGKDPDAGKD